MQSSIIAPLTHRDDALALKNLILYTTSDCHLCEQAQNLLQQLPAGAFSIESVDIAYDDSLLDHYGLRIPVVQLQGREQDLGWPFDLPALEDYLG